MTGCRQSSWCCRRRGSRRTEADGTFTIEGVPEGKHSVVAWHELSKLKPEDTAQAVLGDSPPCDFTLLLGPARARPAMHGTRREP